ncbi:DUF4252 domain-containing protein [Pseudochryseolinea flava]|uniref:DUF4252 domain-containing protein n=1 Tax=Pseudochryseolinea flava TaxID=2059302 RepID=A0A364XZU3_9BACT|nr:DUF4252 domain-containing protein [Pseudochryseolinea flava]RAV99850.1 hypothetical protein DQQ10_17570 [Pseudochryseolinea flava]
MRYPIMFMLVAVSFFTVAQTKTTEALDKKYSSRTFFLYHNTLRMVNQSENAAFDELIKDIEKMKVVWVNKKEKNFTNDNFKKLISDYRSESFEEIMNSRHEGRNFNVLMKEKNGKTLGMLAIVNDTESVYVLDIVGSIALNNVMELFKTLDSSADIGERIKTIANKSEKKAEQ